MPPPKPDTATNPDATPDVVARTRPFADVLAVLNRGRTHPELSAALQDLVADVAETRRKGTITLTLSITAGKADGVIEVSDQITVKPPTRDRAASIFFIDDGGNLVREDPMQLQLPLIDINSDQRRGR